MQSLGKPAQGFANDEFNRTAESDGTVSLRGQTDTAFENQDLTTAINYRRNDVSSLAQEAAATVNAFGPLTVAGVTAAINSNERVTSAFIDDAANAQEGAEIVSGGAIRIEANNRYHVDQVPEVCSGSFSVGASISDTDIDNTVEAYLGNFGQVEAVGAVTILASDQDSGGRSKAQSIAGSGAGFIAVAANISRLELNSNTTARLKMTVSSVAQAD